MISSGDISAGDTPTPKIYSFTKPKANHMVN